MNTRFLLLVLSVAAFSSCTTAYKSGQTPDDVYYSPAREIPQQEEYTRIEKVEDDYVNPDDRYLRMKSYNRNRWSAFDDDYNYWNDNRWNNQVYYSNLNWYNNWRWNTYFGSYWNNPFCPTYYGSPIVIVNPKPVYINPKANGPRVINLNTYNGNDNTVYDPKRGWINTGSRSGSTIRVFGNNNSGGNSRSSYYNSNNSSPVRTFDRSNNSSPGSSNNSGSRSSGSSGSAPVRTFPKGGGGQ